MARILANLKSAAAAAKKTTTAVKNTRINAAAPLDWDPTNHLLSRFAFGATAADRANVSKIGLDAWYAQQVSLAKAHPGYTAHSALSAYGSLLTMNPYDLSSTMIAQGKQYHWDAMDQLTQVTLGLQTYSPAQLYETLVDFFSNHLNVPNHNGDLWASRPDYDLNVIRKYAMGSFTDMLIAASKSPAMLTSLNLGSSTKNAINENYAREMLELHTVGLRYSETDVRNAARMLTGRTLDQFGHYVYDDFIHATGAIAVLGFKHANTSAAAGEAAGDAMLAYLAAHPYTAQHLAQKMCMRYVSDTPSASLVSAVAQAYIDNKTQILPMVQTILRSDEFWAARGQKVRRPAENLVAAVRTLGVVVTDWSKALPTLHWMTSSMANVPLDWPAPNGYPDVATAWRSGGTLLSLWSYHLAFVGNWASGFGPVDVSALYGGKTPATSGEAIDLLTNAVTGVTFTGTHRDAVVSLLSEPATTPIAKSRIRWLLTYVIGMALHSPEHALR